MSLLRGNKKYTRCAHLYIETNGDKVIVVACYKHGVGSGEIPDSTEICSKNDKQVIGEILKLKLASCIYKPKFDYSGHTKKDWPAFTASKLKTAKSFKSSYIQYVVCGINESNTCYEIIPTTLINNIQLKSSFSASEIDLQVGVEVMKMHEFYLKCRDVT